MDHSLMAALYHRRDIPSEHSGLRAERLAIASVVLFAPCILAGMLQVGLGPLREPPSTSNRV